MAKMMEAIGKEFHWIRQNMMTKNEGQALKQDIKKLDDRMSRQERISKATFKLLDTVDQRTRHLPDQTERIDKLEVRVFKLEQRV